MIVLSFPRSGRTWLQLQLVYYAIPSAVRMHPLNALQLLGSACKELGINLTFTHGDYHMADNPKKIEADILLTRNFCEIQKSFNPIFGNVSETRYKKMLSDNSHAWKLDYADRLAHPEGAFKQFLVKIGAPVGDVSASVNAASIVSLKKFNRLSYIAGVSFGN